MKSDIVFFDTVQNSITGTLRGMVIFPIYIILTFVWFYFTKKPLYDKHIDKVDSSRIYFTVMFSSLLIVSALGVHNPSSVQKAVVFAALLGFVVYGISNCALLSFSKKWDFSISIIDTIWGVCSTALLGVILYYVVGKFPVIFDYK